MESEDVSPAIEALLHYSPPGPPSSQEAPISPQAKAFLKEVEKLRQEISAKQARAERPDRRAVGKAHRDNARPKGVYVQFRSVAALLLVGMTASLVTIALLNYGWGYQFFFAHNRGELGTGPFIEQVAMLEGRAKQLQNAPAESLQVLKLRNDFAVAPIEVAALAWQSEAFVRFMDRTRPVSPDQLAAELELQVDNIQQHRKANTSREDSVNQYYINSVYASIRLLPGENHGKIAPRLVDFLLDARPDSQVGLIVPCFFHTMNESDRLNWDRIVALADKDLPVKLVNTRQFTKDLTPDSDFVRAFGEAIDFANQHQVEVYAYVNCDGGGKSLMDAQDEVRKWHDFYGKRFKGVYFDNQAMFNDDKLDFFRKLFAFTTELEPDWKIISATGGECDEAYGKLLVDSIICFKTDGVFPRFKGWEKSYGRERFGAIIFNVPEFMETETKTIAAIFGWVFIGELPEPKTKSLPEYLEKEAAFLKKLNTKQRVNDQKAGDPSPSGRAA